MAYNITDLLFKLSQNRRPTSEDKRLLEEEARYASILLSQQVWASALDPNPAVSVSTGSAALDTDLALTADPTTPSGQENSIWLSAYEDYIPPNVVPDDAGYTTTIKDNSGTIIPDGKQAEYGVLFLHKMGVLLIQDPTGFASEYSFPPKITSYRYTGTVGLGAGGGGAPSISGAPATNEVAFWASPTAVGGIPQFHWSPSNTRLILGALLGLQWLDKTLITAPDNGSLRISNSAGNEFLRLVLGAANSAFPAVYRDGSGIKVLKADGLSWSHIATGRIDAEELVRLKEQALSAGAEATYGKLYAKTDGHLYFLDSSGSETNLTAGSSVMQGDCLATDAVGDFVYITGNKVGTRIQVTKADITNGAKMPAFGVIIDKPTSDTCTVQWTGEVSGVFSGLTAGSVHFLSDTGVPVPTLPAPGVTHYLQKLGVATSSNSLVLQGSSDLVKRPT
jgi:hypothetical protein